MPSNDQPQDSRKDIILISSEKPLCSDIEVHCDPPLLLPPFTKRMSQEQLRVELRSVYSGLVLVEIRCKDVDREQKRLALEEATIKVAPEQWVALIALHMTLLYEFHDFLLASQHPLATPNLSDLAARSSTGRLLQSGIYNFLEVLWYRLPGFLDHKLAFISTAYSMIALMFKTIPAFANIWIECLGDLGRCRMAIAEDSHDRELWCNISRYWYLKAWKKYPNIGRFAHRLAISSSPYTFEQLSLYLRSLISIVPFNRAKIDVVTILDTVLYSGQDLPLLSSPVEILLLKLVAIMFTRQRLGEFSEVLSAWKVEIVRYIHQSGSIFQSQGMLVMICTSAGFYEFSRSDLDGVPLSLFRQTQEKRPAPSRNATRKVMKIASNRLSISPEEDYRLSLQTINLTSSVVFATLAILLEFPNNANVYSAVHEYLVMISEYIHYSEIMTLIQADVPWVHLANFLNRTTDQEYAKEFPCFPIAGRPLPEDYARQGLLYGWNYVTQAYLDEAGISEYERELELPTMAHYRKQRMHYLGRGIAIVRLSPHCMKALTFYRSVSTSIFAQDHAYSKSQSSQVDFPGGRFSRFQIFMLSS